MAESYRSAMGPRVLFWMLAAFSVGGVLVSPFLDKQYPWVGTLVALGLLIPLGTHSWWVHKRVGEAEKKHQDSLGALRQQLAEEATRREQAERQVAEVPADIVARLVGLLTDGVVSEVVRGLRERAALVGRLRRFAAA